MPPPYNSRRRASMLARTALECLYERLYVFLYTLLCKDCAERLVRCFERRVCRRWRDALSKRGVRSVLGNAGSDFVVMSEVPQACGEMREKCAHRRSMVLLWRQMRKARCL